MNENEKKINSLMAFSDIDESVIGEAMAFRSRRRSPLAYAAAALLIIGAALALTVIIKGKMNVVEAVLPTQKPMPAESAEPVPTAGFTGAPTIAPLTEQPGAVPTQMNEPGTTDEPAAQTPDATEKTPAPTEDPAPKPTGAPSETGRPAPTPEATQKPAPKPTSKPTGAPQATNGPKPTGTPKTYTYYTEEEFITAVLSADESDELLYGIDRYFIPAAVPGGAALERIKVSLNAISLIYASETGEREYEFAWLRGQTPEECFSTLDILHHGSWHGEFYIAESSYIKVFREQYGCVFYSRLPLGSETALIESFCNAVEKVV